MALQSLKEQYADWISQQIASKSNDLKTFEDWQHLKFQDVPGIFSVPMVSEVLQSVVTLRVEASSMSEAREKAKGALRQIESKFQLERDPKSGKPLTPEQQREKLIKQAERILVAAERRRQNLIKQAMKLAGIQS